MSRTITREQAIALLTELQAELNETVETLNYLSDKFNGEPNHITAIQAHINSARSQKHLIQQLAKQLWRKPL